MMKQETYSVKQFCKHCDKQVSINLISLTQIGSWVYLIDNECLEMYILERTYCNGRVVKVFYSFLDAPPHAW